jgi:hypothetical protein
LELTESFFLLILNAWEKLAGNEIQGSLFPPNPVCTVAWVCPKLITPFFFNEEHGDQCWNFGFPIFEQPASLIESGQGR